ncbi:MAG TPA: SUMF1/EgtB/PvdO family nonheme iron enzyme [Candidatus Dormibacteraeota bacterium]|jgi:formylglycine-generating enzyme required for sulfatase activity|nr:SUMF1/EgtB/PvdO family nonheme iron enzyme [Candidatus Dormibacteraeota bacterium]
MRTRPTIRALIIGVDNFKNREVGDLTKAVADAAGFAEVLRQFGGPDENIHTLLGADATCDSVHSAIDNLRAVPLSTRAGESLVVFIATHGRRMARRPPTHLLWYDSCVQDGHFVRATRQDHWIDHIKDLGFCQKLLILDACHTGHDKPWPLEERLPDFAAVKLPFYLEKPAMQVIAAAGANEKAFEQQSGPHGTLTGYLLDALRSFLDTGSGVLAASRLASDVRERISLSPDACTFQTTQFWREDGDGDFLFVHPKGMVPEFHTPRTRELEQSYRAQSLEIDACRYRRQGQFEIAKDLLAQALTQDPANERLLVLLEETTIELLKKQKSDECQQHLQGLAREARLAMDQGELQKAQGLIKEGMGYGEKYEAEIPAGFRQLTVDLDRQTQRQTQRAVRQAFNDILFRADHHERHENWAAALNVIENGLPMATGEPQWESLFGNKKTILERKLRAQIDRELTKKLQEVEALIGANEWERAQHLLESTCHMSPNPQIIRQFIPRYELWRETYFSHAAAAIKAQQAGSYAQAFDLWNMVIGIAPDYPLLGIHRAVCKSKLALPPPTIRKSVRDGLEYVLIPAGEFLMGAVPQDREATKAEKPRHLAHVDKPFWINRTPVTHGAFSRFNDNRGIIESPRNPRLPARGIRFDEAEDFCKFAGGRLPTEAEWELAARSGRESIYPWGDDAIDQSRACFKRAAPCPVQQFPPTPGGLFDVIGNVWEWCSDKFFAGYEAYGPDRPSSTQRVVRGGSFTSNASEVRISCRQGRSPNLCYQDVGVRCVRDDPMD